jgi:glycosyltransferase involved in cell wall biosynthesis
VRQQGPGVAPEPGDEIVSKPAARIIFVNRVYWPSTAATAQLLTDLAEGLAARGREVHVIASGDTGTTRAGVVIHRTGGPEHHTGMLSRVMNYRRFRVEACRRLAELAQPGDVVVAMTDPPLLGNDVTAAATARGARVVHWVQDIYPEIAGAHFGGLAVALLAPLRSRRDAAWRAAARCVTLGQDMARTLQLRGVSPEKITLVPNWAPRELQSPPAPDAIAARRAAWGATQQFVVAYSGNLGRVHEFAAVLAAARRLRSSPEILFLFIGSGAQWAQVEAVARRELPNVRLLPPEPRENLAASLAAADAHLVTLKPAFSALVYPSKLAGVLAAGRPVLFVGKKDAEIATWLRTAQCGAAFGPDEGEGLAEAIRRWSRDPAACLTMGSAARRAYETHFTYAAALASWDAILADAAE